MSNSTEYSRAVRAKLNARRGPEDKLPVRGRLRTEWKREYEAILAEEADGMSSPTLTEPGDYGDGTSPADFPGGDEPNEPIGAGDPPLSPDPSEEPPTPPEPERIPRKVRARGSGSLRNLFGVPGKAKTKGSSSKGRSGRSRSRPAYPWVSTASVIETIWTQAAHAAGGIMPLRKILCAQAPMAGVVLEGATRDTIADVVLQPLARNFEKFDAVDAMIGPPFWTLAITLFGGAETKTVHNDQANEDVEIVVMNPATGLPMWDDRTEGMIMALRFSLMSWLRVASKNADEIIERAEEQGRMADQADRLINWLLTPEPGARFEDVRAQAEAHATAFTTGAAWEKATTETAPGNGQPSDDRSPSSPFPGGSAFAPRAAIGASGGD